MSDDEKSAEEKKWQLVREKMGECHVSLGQHWSFNIRNDPKRLAFVLSRYKFAAKMGSTNKHVIELGCSEGLGGVILGESAISYTGVDYDHEAIDAAQRNWLNPKFNFVSGDILDGETFGVFDTAVSLDVIEHISLEYEETYLRAVARQLHSDGIALVGTPNATAWQYASAPSKAAHINNYTHERLKEAMAKHFSVVFMFSFNDETMHTGFAPMAHYIMAVGCGRKDA